MLIYDLKSEREGGEIPKGGCFALGSFDGVHAGHRRVISESVAKAKKSGCESVVWCLAPTGKAGAFGKRLTLDGEKLAVFASLGVDRAIFEDFEAVCDMSPEDFVGDYLRKLGCRSVATGSNFRFGKGAAADVTDLSRICADEGIACSAVETVTADGVAVSSTVIRELVEAGDVEKARRFLEGDFFMMGEVTHGRTIGKTIGFPTVNLRFENGKIIPKHGVYFTETDIGGERYPSVTNVGIRPTVGGHECRAETHILSFDEDLYGRRISVRFKRFSRPERKLPDKGALREMIAEDVSNTKRYFEKAGGENER